MKNLDHFLANPDLKAHIDDLIMDLTQGVTPESVGVFPPVKSEIPPPLELITADQRSTQIIAQRKLIRTQLHEKYQIKLAALLATQADEIQAVKAREAAGLEFCRLSHLERDHESSRFALNIQKSQEEAELMAAFENHLTDQNRQAASLNLTNRTLQERFDDRFKKDLASYHAEVQSLEEIKISIGQRIAQGLLNAVLIDLIMGLFEKRMQGEFITRFDLEFEKQLSARRAAEARRKAHRPGFRTHRTTTTN